jgi:hypothetical protein
MNCEIRAEKTLGERGGADSREIDILFSVRVTRPKQQRRRSIPPLHSRRTSQNTRSPPFLTFLTLLRFPFSHPPELLRG